MLKKVLLCCTFILYAKAFSPIATQIVANGANGFLDGSNAFMATLKDEAINGNIYLVLDALKAITPPGPLQDSLTQLSADLQALYELKAADHEDIHSGIKTVRKSYLLLLVFPTNQSADDAIMNSDNICYRYD